LLSLTPCSRFRNCILFADNLTPNEAKFLGSQHNASPPPSPLPPSPSKLPPPLLFLFRLSHCLSPMTSQPTASPALPTSSMQWIRPPLLPQKALRFFFKKRILFRRKYFYPLEMRGYSNYTNATAVGLNEIPPTRRWRRNWEGRWEW
jgi:hypothetical protein